MTKMDKNCAVSENDYTKEYNDSIEEINRLNKQLEEVYKECERICRDASRSSWFYRTPRTMATHCADLIHGYGSRKGLNHQMPYPFMYYNNH